MSIIYGYRLMDTGMNGSCVRTVIGMTPGQLNVT